MSVAKNNIQGQIRNQKFVDIAVDVAEDKVERVAEIAARVVMQHNPNISVTLDQLKAFNAVALKAALIKAIDEGVKIPSMLKVPCYFDSLIVGLITQMGRSTIRANYAGSEVVLPEDYRDVVTALTIAGVKLVRPHGPVETTSSTLHLFLETVDDVEVITGNLTDIALEDVIRRSLLKVKAEDEAVLKGIAGELRFQYGELDDLILKYYTAEVGTAS